ncbi:MAG: hypothetical protein V1494_06065 [Candidatus Diapherotrites archaeon]
MKHDLRVLIGLAVVVLVVASLAVYLASVGSANSSELVLVIVALVIVFGAVVFLRDRIKSSREGLPAEDELSRRAVHKAGYYAYFASIYTALGAMFINDFLVGESGFQGIDAGQLSGIVILVPAIVFMAFALYFRHKGAVE